MRLALLMCVVFLLTSGLMTLGFCFSELGEATPLRGPTERTRPAGDLSAAAAALADQLQSFDLATRRQAVEGLVDLGPDAAVAVPMLTQALKDDDEAIRILAARALGRVGPRARSALPALTEAFKDRSQAVLQEAIVAVRRIDVNGGATEN